MSMSEELQSAKVELETLKEELQSLKEELSSVRNQLQDKVEELDRSNNDLTRLLAEALSHLGEGVLITSDELDWPGPSILFVNQAMCRISGYSADELLGKSPRVLQGLDSGRETLDKIKRELSSGQSCTVEVVNYRKDGTSYDAELYITPLFDAQGRRTNFVSLHRDISERKRAEEALLQKKAELRAAQRITHIGNWYWDARTGVTTGSEEMCRIFGYDPQVPNLPPFQEHKGRLLSVPDWDRLNVAMQETLRTGIGYELDLQATRNGEPFWFTTRSEVVRNAEGEIIALRGTVQDITERRRVEQNLRRMSKVFTDATTAIYIKDMTGKILDLNLAAERECGWTRAELLGQSYKMLVPPSEHSIRDALIARCLAGEEIRGVSTLRLLKGGEILPILLTLSLLTDDTGEPIGIASISEDMTQLRQVEQSLRTSEETMRAILNTAADAIITIDQHGIIESINPATERMFGYSRSELVGNNVSMLMPAPFRDEHDAYIARFLRTREARIIGIGRELVGLRKDGSTLPIALAVSAVDHLGLFTGIIRDISAVKELQKQVLEIAAEEDRRIGHELHDNVQQQLTGLGLLAQTLSESILREMPQQAKVATRLAGGIKDAAGQLHLLARGLVPVEVDAEGLRAALADLAAKVSEVNGLTCSFHCEQSVEVADNFMATHLFRIAQEAVNNAVKHSRAERIELTLSATDGCIKIEVLDNGVGIGDKRDSSGVGLRIMQYRADLLGGSLRIEPLDTKGTLVTCMVRR